PARAGVGEELNPKVQQAAGERRVGRTVSGQPLVTSERVAPVDNVAKFRDEVREAREKKQDSINRKALEATNRGRSPRSRFYVRGILHPRPGLMWVAANLAILVRLSFVAFVVLLTLMFFRLIPYTWAFGMLLLPVTAIPYFIFAGQARCRVCGQKEFMPSGARKHVKTHRIPFLGPIISTALHMLIFSWFHCMFCGTAIRTKK
ncbi:MAG: hypothetical protein AAGC74_09960, partial [Verrucomicrobiota bacterium]